MDSVEDILEEFCLINLERSSNNDFKDNEVDDELQKKETVMQNIIGQNITTDYIVNMTGFSPKKVNLILSKLELKGKIK